MTVRPLARYAENYNYQGFAPAWNETHDGAVTGTWLSTGGVLTGQQPSGTARTFVTPFADPGFIVGARPYYIETGLWLLDPIGASTYSEAQLLTNVTVAGPTYAAPNSLVVKIRGDGSIAFVVGGTSVFTTSVAPPTSSLSAVRVGIYVMTNTAELYINGGLVFTTGTITTSSSSYFAIAVTPGQSTAGLSCASFDYLWLMDDVGQPPRLGDPIGSYTFHDEFELVDGSSVSSLWTEYSDNPGTSGTPFSPSAFNTFTYEGAVRLIGASGTFIDLYNFILSPDGTWTNAYYETRCWSPNGGKMALMVEAAAGYTTNGIMLQIDNVGNWYLFNQAAGTLASGTIARPVNRKDRACVLALDTRGAQLTAWVDGAIVYSAAYTSAGAKSQLRLQQTPFGDPLKAYFDYFRVDPVFTTSGGRGGWHIGEIIEI